MEEPVSDFLYNHLYIYLSLCYQICGFFFVYKISPEKKIAQREKELHGLKITSIFSLISYFYSFTLFLCWEYAVVQSVERNRKYVVAVGK
jgi:hypothetical protein